MDFAARRNINILHFPLLGSALFRHRVSLSADPATAIRRRHHITPIQDLPRSSAWMLNTESAHCGLRCSMSRRNPYYRVSLSADPVVRHVTFIQGWPGIWIQSEHVADSPIRCGIAIHTVDRLRVWTELHFCRSRFWVYSPSFIPSGHSFLDSAYISSFVKEPAATLIPKTLFCRSLPCVSYSVFGTLVNALYAASNFQNHPLDHQDHWTWLGDVSLQLLCDKLRKVDIEVSIGTIITLSPVGLATCWRYFASQVSVTSEHSTVAKSARRGLHYSRT